MNEVRVTWDDLAMSKLFVDAILTSSSTLTITNLLKSAPNQFLTSLERTPRQRGSSLLTQSQLVRTMSAQIELLHRHWRFANCSIPATRNTFVKSCDPALDELWNCPVASSLAFVFASLCVRIHLNQSCYFWIQVNSTKFTTFRNCWPGDGLVYNILDLIQIIEIWI